ncbi:MAG: type II CAAX endopeptidase family protein [Desulfobacterales bacterium]
MATENIGPKPFFTSLALVITVEVFRSALLPGTAGMVELGVIRLIEIFLVSFPFITRGKNLAPLGLSREKILPGIRKGIIWSTAFGIITGIGVCIMFFFKKSPLDMIRIGLPERPSDIILFFLVGGLIAPVAEEFFFRGLLYGFLRRWGVVFAIMVSTLLFAVAHPKVSIIPITGGILFAVSYEKEKNLLVPIIIHTLGNLSLFTLSLLS